MVMDRGDANIPLQHQQSIVTASIDESQSQKQINSITQNREYIDAGFFNQDMTQREEKKTSILCVVGEA